jgi:replicative DNA helicase
MRDGGTILAYPLRATAEARALPTNIDLEQQFLGALLINNELLPAVSGFLKPEHFSEEIHRRIYTLSASLIGDGRLASPVTLKTYLGEHDVGGGITVPQYLARLVTDASAPRCAPDYGRAICDLAARRAIIEAARAAIEQARDAPVETKPPEISSNAIAAFQAIAEASSDGQTRVHPGEAAAAVLDRARAILAGEKIRAGVPTGLPDLDMRTGGFNPGELWVVGGRPGQGKTVLATGFARKTSEHGARLMAAGEQGLGALLFSLELPKDQLIARLLSDLAYRPRQPISYGQIMRGELAPDDIDRLERARERLGSLPFAIDVAPALSVAEIASRVRAEKDRMRRRNMRLSVVFIDYLKFVTATDRYRGLRVYEIGEITAQSAHMHKP